ncbi:MAG: hypothetical protein IPI17_06000 [Nitrosomonas sp.]|jgi:hypothetical protein|nr:hypothetical protein [Nitrosomonas sp.]
MNWSGLCSCGFSPDAVDDGFDFILENADQFLVGIDQALFGFDLGDDSALGVDVRQRYFESSKEALNN